MEVWPCTAWEECGGGCGWDVSNIPSSILFPVFALVEQGCNWEIRGLVGCWCWTKAGWLESHGWLHGVAALWWEVTLYKSADSHPVCVYARRSEWERERDKGSKIQQQAHTVSLCEEITQHLPFGNGLKLDKQQGRIHCKTYRTGNLCRQRLKTQQTFFHHLKVSSLSQTDQTVSPDSALAPQLQSSLFCLH